MIISHVYPAKLPGTSILENQALASTVGAGGLAETVKTLLSKFLDVVGALLGTKQGGGGGGGGGLKAKAKSSKAKKSKSSGAGFKEAFETKYGKR